MMEGAETGQQFNKDFYHYTKVDCYRLIPLGKVVIVKDGKPQGWLAIDGEVIDYSPFQVECKCFLILFNCARFSLQGTV